MNILKDKKASPTVIPGVKRQSLKQGKIILHVFNLKKTYYIENIYENPQLRMEAIL